MSLLGETPGHHPGQIMSLSWFRNTLAFPITRQRCGHVCGPDLLRWWKRDKLMEGSQSLASPVWLLGKNINCLILFKIFS